MTPLRDDGEQEFPREDGLSVSKYSFHVAPMIQCSSTPSRA